MFVHGIESHVAIITILLLIGVPTNIAVVWIHTRKDSRVAKNKFALIFAAIDLISLVVALPMRLVHEVYSDVSATENLANVIAVFVVNGYLCTLMTATTDKFYAVMFPFRYGQTRATIFKAAIAVTTIPNAVLTFAIPTLTRICGAQIFKYLSRIII